MQASGFGGLEFGVYWGLEGFLEGFRVQFLRGRFEDLTRIWPPKKARNSPSSTSFNGLFFLIVSSGL